MGTGSLVKLVHAVRASGARGDGYWIAPRGFAERCAFESELYYHMYSRLSVYIAFSAPSAIFPYSPLISASSIPLPSIYVPEGAVAPQQSASALRLYVGIPRRTRAAAAV